MKEYSTIEGLVTDEERALYNICDCQIDNCVFAGVADGESALKECRNISVKNCSFSLRYPLWHAQNYTVEDCTMDERARAAVWYGQNGKIKNCTLNGIKVFRECLSTEIEKCSISSPEAMWHCNGINILNCNINSEYLLLGSRNIKISGSALNGKYPLQYTENVTLENCEITAKDSLWHAKNVVAKNCVLRGEYLAWYSENVTLIDCLVDGTQPLCYCKKLKLINCRTENCDRAFELSEVDADIKGEIVSVRSPLSGVITCDGVGEIINDVTAYSCKGKTVIRRGRPA